MGNKLSDLELLALNSSINLVKELQRDIVGLAVKADLDKKEVLALSSQTMNIERWLTALLQQNKK